MTSRPSPRHAAARSAPRRIALPSVLLTAAAVAFGGLALLPGPSSLAPRVTAADALQPEPVAAPPTPASTVTPNIALDAALTEGLAVVNAPKPRPSPQRASRSRDSARSSSTTGSAKPAAEYVRPGLGRRTSAYGRRWGRLHAGVDLAAGAGSPVRAVTRGVVQSARRESGYGLCVRVRHPDGTVSVYAHMSKLLVRAGEKVSAGERVGLEGNTGRSTGPHLHFEIRINGTPVNPSAWLRKRGVAV